MIISYIIFVVCIIGLIGFIGSSEMLHPKRFKGVATPMAYSMMFQAPKIRSRDKSVIASWLIPSKDNKATIIVCHGYSTGKYDCLDIAKMLNEGGYNALLIDMRGHGESEGDRCTFGKREIEDVEACINFIKNHPVLGKGPIGIFGLSMGASIAFLSASKFDDIKAVVGDSSYAYLKRAVKRWYERGSILRIWRLADLSIAFAQIRLRKHLIRLSPMNYIDKIAPKPLFIIHGDRDGITPTDDIEKLFQKAKHPKKLWISNDTEHVLARINDPHEYKRRLIEFFDSSLK